MFTPVVNNRCYEFFGKFKEGQGLFIDDPTLVSNAVGREVSRVKAAGIVTISINVTQRNFERHGYITENNLK